MDKKIIITTLIILVTIAAVTAQIPPQEMVEFLQMAFQLMEA